MWRNTKDGTTGFIHHSDRSPAEVRTWPTRREADDYRRVLLAKRNSKTGQNVMEIMIVEEDAH